MRKQLDRIAALRLLLEALKAVSKEALAIK
jgi:hypothetical protein